MRKILSIIFVGVFIASAFSAIGTSVNIKKDKDINETLVVNLNNPDMIYNVNFKQKNDYEKDIYTPKPLTQLLQGNKYVIITTDSLVESITSSGFIEWKESIGFELEIVTITDPLISSQLGIDLAEKIRNFLREYYIEWEIGYLLLVGNYEQVPMRYCYPDPTNHRLDPFDMYSGEVPTDYYYADLSSSDAESWDSDGDGYHGEYGQDNPDFNAEIAVGRIPTNNADRVKYTLEKTIGFEQDTDEWKTHALNAGAFFYFTNQNNNGHPAMDGAVLSYYIENDLMDGWTVSHYSEQQGLEKSVYDWPALNENSFISDWKNGQYSIVNWQGHGWTNKVAHCVWSTDDGDGVPENPEITWPNFIRTGSNLDDDYPSIVTAVSCYVGCPEIYQNSNLGIDLLTNPSLGAAVGVVASARSPYGSIGWSPTSPGGSDSIIYEFNKNMILNEDRVGDALYNSKYYCNHNFGWNSYLENLDMYTFNLYGDPSLKLQGINVEGTPEKPVISGPAKAKIRQEHTFTALADDPDNDDIYYYFSWGDGTNSDWIGPMSSGEECQAVHTWQKKGDYEIKVRVKDENGLMSEWSDPIPVKMPKDKSYLILDYLGLLIDRILEKLFVKIIS